MSYVCALDIFETILRSLWESSLVRRAWDDAIGIINNMKTTTPHNRPWGPLDWQHGTIGKKFLSPLANTQEYGFFLEASLLWTIWIKSNDMMFNKRRWDEKKVHQTILLGLLDYAHFLGNLASKEAKITYIFNEFLDNYDVTWGANKLPCHYSA